MLPKPRKQHSCESSLLSAERNVLTLEALKRRKHVDKKNTFYGFNSQNYPSPGTAPLFLGFVKLFCPSGLVFRMKVKSRRLATHSIQYIYIRGFFFSVSSTRVCVLCVYVVCISLYRSWNMQINKYKSVVEFFCRLSQRGRLKQDREEEEMNTFHLCVTFGVVLL